MLDLYDEAGADAEVARILLKHKKEKSMSVVLYRDETNNIVEVVTAQPIDREQLEKRVEKLKKDLASAEKALDNYDVLDGANNQPEPTKAPEAPAAAVPPSEQPVQTPPAAPAPLPEAAPVDAVTPPEVQPAPQVAPAETELKPQPIVMG